MNILRTIRNFYTDVVSEFKRVTWPTREATLKSTGVVLFVTFVVAVYLGVVDLGLSNAVKMVIK